MKRSIIFITVFVLLFIFYLANVSAGCGCNSNPAPKVSENQGNLNSSLEKINETKELSAACNGCILENECVPAGYRINKTYCGAGNHFLIQKKASEPCQNNFECMGNSCIDGNCASNGLLQGLFIWAKKLFHI